MTAFSLALIAAFIWGTAPLLEKIGINGADPMAGLWARSVGVFAGGVFLSFLVPDLPGKLAQMGWKSFACLAGGGFLASVVGQSFFYRALKTGEMSRVAPVSGAWPLIAFFLGVLFLGEGLTAKKLAGAFFVVLGVVLIK